MKLKVAYNLTESFMMERVVFMTDILDEIISSNRLGLLGKEPLEPPLSFYEQEIVEYLQTLDGETARDLRDRIQSAVMERHMDAVRAGIRFGARLAAELADPPEEIV